MAGVRLLHAEATSSAFVQGHKCAQPAYSAAPDENGGRCAVPPLAALLRERANVFFHAAYLRFYRSTFPRCRTDSAASARTAPNTIA
ncbi:MAG: hypothetical protein EOO65_00595 [Methanosarcinales archaeon]|nr:MAG: hypothetical protein EOO65_00595 [Methanosarcinales archaeon]